MSNIRSRVLDKVLLASLICFICSGCAELQIPYLNAGAPGWILGGYSEKKLNEQEYLVSYEGNVYTSAETLRKHLNKRASELCGAENYTISDLSSSSDSHMVMTSGMFFATPSPINSVKVHCDSYKAEYLAKKLILNDREYCVIPIYNSTNYLFFSYLIEVYVNDIYITSLPYRNYIEAPLYKGINKVNLSKPYSSKGKQVEININSCNEKIEISHNALESLNIKLHSGGINPAQEGYELNIK